MNERRLNTKNKILIIVFSLIVLGIIVGMVLFVTKIRNEKVVNELSISANEILFDKETRRIDTSLGGVVQERWNGEYYFVANDGSATLLGESSVIVDDGTGELSILGKNVLVEPSGSFVEGKGITTTELENKGFYKLADRKYLVVAGAIKNDDGTIYAEKFLIVFLDKQGNASFLNDVINVKTINPTRVLFGEYDFDVAREKVLAGNIEVDLKAIFGSTNEYYDSTEEEENEEENILKENLESLVGAYNDLVMDFSQYAASVNANIGATNVVSNTIVINAAAWGSSNDNSVNNSSISTRRADIRGVVAGPNYIDVGYTVTDPNNVYQAVYLLVTGEVDGEMITQKILVDKYNVSYRIGGLTLKSEYNISLGCIEIVKDESGENSLVDGIVDVVNVRTGGGEGVIDVYKIANGKVYYNFQLKDGFAISEGMLVLYEDGVRTLATQVDVERARSEGGMEGVFQMNDAALYEIRLEDAVYNGSIVDLKTSKKFVIQT